MIHFHEQDDYGYIECECGRSLVIDLRSYREGLCVCGRNYRVTTETTYLVKNENDEILLVAPKRA